MTMKKNLCLNIACWNTQGLYSEDGSKWSNIVENINMHDIFIIVETHANYDNSLNVSGYQCFSKQRIKYKKARCNSGGVAIFYKNKFKGGIELLKCSYEKNCNDIIWIKIKKR